MDPQAVRQQADAFCDALQAGDMERATEHFSRELHANLGPTIALLPLPLTEAAVESVEVGGSGYVAMLRLTGESGEVLLQTRWKDRDGKPTVVEVSHAAEQPQAALPTEEEPEA
jgi:hypothetical protein